MPDCIWPNGWRMTGSAFAILIARGTLCRGWLRRITYINTEPREQKGGAGFHRRGGWRMTGSAFASYERRGTLCLRLAPQDNFLRRGRSGGGGCPRCAGSRSDRRLADDGKRLCETSRRGTLY